MGINIGLKTQICEKNMGETTFSKCIQFITTASNEENFDCEILNNQNKKQSASLMNCRKQNKPRTAQASAPLKAQSTSKL